MKIAINGFGRIGRTFFRQAVRNNDIEIVAINDLGDLNTLAYLLKYDTVYGRFSEEVLAETKQRTVGGSSAQGMLTVGGRAIQVFCEKDPGALPWGELGVDVVVESTGVFTSAEKSQPHLNAGAKRVVISAPAKDKTTPTVTPNVGEDNLRNSRITSNASCTTNAATPVASILAANPGIVKGMLTTAHGYTASQNLVDGPNRKIRRGRAAAQNIVPSSTGAAEATERALPQMSGRFDGIALRVPVPAGSIIDFTFLAARKTSTEEINTILRDAARERAWDGIFAVTEDPIVSSDILGEPYGSIADLSMTRVVGGDLVKVLSWYDNEHGYCAMLLKHVLALRTLL